VHERGGLSLVGARRPRRALEHHQVVVGGKAAQRGEDLGPLRDSAPVRQSDLEDVHVALGLEVREIGAVTVQRVRIGKSVLAFEPLGIRGDHRHREQVTTRCHPVTDVESPIALAYIIARGEAAGDRA
jgi:hypothetical protein